MPNTFAPDIHKELQALSAAGRHEVEVALNPGAWRRRQSMQVLRYVIWSVALGIATAGVVVFATGLVLNLLFHFSPS